MSEDDRKRTLRYIFVLASEAGINNTSDRVELAKALLDIGEGLTSYTELSTEDLEAIVFALRSWRTVQELRLANGVLEVEAEVLLRDHGEENASEEDPDD